GSIEIDGQPVSLTSPDRAREHGIETVYQDLALAPELPAYSNMYLGRELVKPGIGRLFGVLDRKRMREATEQAYSRLGSTVRDAKAPVAMLSGGQRQAVAVARASTWATALIFMDEPTAALGVVQTEQVLRLIESIREDGKSVVLISHSMPEVFEVADRIQVLRLGKRVANVATSDVSMPDIVAAMTGATELQGE
ncbi:MAG: ATP-binding cassette domain-containing protein, partial [Beutenbergiaceae bacterium]